MRVLILCIVIAFALAFAAYAGHLHFGLPLADAIAYVALIGVAAALIAILPRRFLRAGESHLSNLYLTVGGQEWITFHFEARILNASEERDILKKVRYVFYHRRSGMFPVLLLFGAREINEPTGTILPCILEPGHSYFVEAKDSFSTDSDRAHRLISEAKDYTDYVLRCKFIFARSPAVTVRVHPHNLVSPKRFSAWLEEQLLRLGWQR